VLLKIIGRIVRMGLRADQVQPESIVYASQCSRVRMRPLWDPDQATTVARALPILPGPDFHVATIEMRHAGRVPALIRVLAHTEQVAQPEVRLEEDPTLAIQLGTA